MKSSCREKASLASSAITTSAKLVALLAFLVVPACAAAPDDTADADQTDQEVKAQSCGGASANPHHCAAGYYCEANDTPDRPGVCKKVPAGVESCKTLTCDSKTH